MSVGDRGVLPTRPRNRRGYALLTHTLGKMRSCANGELSNAEIRTVELKNTIIQAKLFPVASTSHTVSPAKCFRSYVGAGHPTIIPMDASTSPTTPLGPMTRDREKAIEDKVNSLLSELLLSTH